MTLTLRTMVDIARLQIQIDSSGIKVAGRELDTLAKKGTQVGQKLTTRLTLPLVAGMAGAVREAALLEGAFDKFDVVFQGMTKEMREFVDIYNEEFPISRRETVQLAAALQDLLVPMGINREEAAGMTKDWLELAGALSAFNDVPIQQVLEAIRSGMAGQAESLRRFGIDARAAALEQVALEEGLIRAGEAMDEQVRQQALLIQATNQSADAVGGLEEQKGSLLWQIEELKRDTKDLAAIYGEELIPVAGDLITTSSDLATWFKTLDEDQRKLVVKAGLLVAAVGPAVGGLSWAYLGLAKAVKGTTVAVRGMTAAMASNPYFLLAAGVAALGVEIFNTHQETKDLEEALSSAFNGGLSSMDEANQLIIQIEERIASLKQAGIQSGWMDTEEVKRLQDALTKIIKKRDELALKEGLKFFADNRSEVDETTRAVEELIKSVDRVTLAAKKPEDYIFDPVEAANIRQIRREADEFNNTLDNILNTDFDWSHRMLPPESLGGAQQALNNLQNRLQAATDPEEVREIREEMEHWQGVIDGLNGEVGQLESAVASLRRPMEYFLSDSIHSMMFFQEETKMVRNEFGELEEQTYTLQDRMGELFDSLLQDISRTLNELLIVKPLMDSLFGVNYGTGELGGFFGKIIGEKAMGGPVSQGETYLVGERGPEIFSPNRSGTIIPNHQISSGAGHSTNVNVNVSVQNEVPNAQVDIQKQRMPNGDIELVAIVKDINKKLHNSGQMDRTMAQNYGVRRKGNNYG